MSGGQVVEFAISAMTGVLNGKMPTRICQGADSRMWFTEFQGSTFLGARQSIGAMTTSGVCTEYPLPKVLQWGNVVAGGSRPFGICQGPDGRCYITEQIGRITAMDTSGNCTPYPLPPAWDPTNALPTDIAQMAFEEQCTFAMPGIYALGTITAGGGFSIQRTLNPTVRPVGVNGGTGPTSEYFYADGSLNGQTAGHLANTHGGGGFVEQSWALTPSGCFSVQATSIVQSSDASGHYWIVTRQGGLAVPNAVPGRAGLLSVVLTGGNLSFGSESLPAGTDPQQCAWEAFSTFGRLYVTDPATNAVLQIDLNTGIPVPIPLLTPHAYPAGCCFGPDSKLYVCLRDVDKIAQITPM